MKFCQDKFQFTWINSDMLHICYRVNGAQVTLLTSCIYKHMKRAAAHSFKRQSETDAFFSKLSNFYFDLRQPGAEPRARKRSENRTPGATRMCESLGVNPGGMFRLGIDCYIMDVETLQLEVECLLASSDVDQLSEVGYVLKMGKETLAGLSKLNLLKRVCQKLEEVIEAGKPEDNVELPNELKGQLQGVKPPPLETYDEELKEAEKAVSDTKKKYEALVTEQQKELEKALEKLELVKGEKGDDLVTKNVAKG